MNQQESQSSTDNSSAEEASLRPAADVRFRAVMGEGIVIRQRAGEVLVLNEVGVRILQLVAEGHSKLSMAATLLSEFDTDEESIKEDLELFSGQLLEAGVIERVPTEESAPGSSSDLDSGQG